MFLKKFTVLEKLFWGSEPNKAGVLDQKTLKTIELKIIRKVWFIVNPASKVRASPVGMEQRVKYLKTLYRGAESLIFESYSGVNSSRIGGIFKIMKDNYKQIYYFDYSKN